ncbi:MAG TPA: hypothetical protein VF181_08075 [Balneolaceae bacterium]
MKSSGKVNYLTIAQGIYFFITGIWPILHIESFIAVTGPKTDIWLVKTVGMLALAIGVGLLAAGIKRQLSLPLVLIAAGSAFGFALVDIIYVWKAVIDPIYLLDAFIELILLVFWLVLMFKPRHRELF